jgi:hypothetical protein
MVLIRTRYAIALYMVIFGSLIVAAYKMGMVHERPLVVRRQELGHASAGETRPVVEPGTVLVISDDEQASGNGGNGGNGAATAAPAANSVGGGGGVAGGTMEVATRG